MGSTDRKAPLHAVPLFFDLRVAGVAPADELRTALAAPRPWIPPKFFYDGLGSRLFEAICELPEYPLTRAEAAILARHADAIAERAGSARVLVDLGAGNCAKGERMSALLGSAQYVPVDIAGEFLAAQLPGIAQRNPGLDVVALAQDFTQVLQLPDPVAPGPRVVFYPGSSIGNFAPDQALALLVRCRAACAGGHLVLGVDLVRDKHLLDLAYDDPLGVTAAFNLNVLRNANRVLGADFDVADWRHVAFFDPVTSRVEMHVEARVDVAVRWDGGAREFRATDRIHTENSYKYTAAGVRALLQRAGYGDVRLFVDDAKSFAVAVAQA